MSSKSFELSVGQVAKRAGVQVSTLHFYEQKGLITSLRNQGNQRRYQREVLRRISIIKVAQRLGISLTEIKAALSSLPNNRTPNQADWAKLSTQWQAQLTQRIDMLQNLKDSLDGCIGCGCLSMTNCPIYNDGDYLADKGNGAVLLK
ncbi:redox-sensitive transcriptional activator SoxR [Shewanella intestini]|uniref:Redox-sensitive transcriptional activator SoxR n=1 Tax=Shewanella intestini TaxID=2017544 RepID=A0ABS5HZR2_9GAMM|nr:MULTISPECIES: redox-sensitive transcriptional activator SoxR [Shewanella]MBR9727068.1 redox-sensitive transcriptional activator SoxR [Shewanella intestini]MRG35870.1 redox-sensitive transcriptional activator SoxR [Shewanella sp. XMDDZSB0408]